MIYYVITTKDEILKITNQEFKNLAGKAGLIYVPSLDQYINISFIYRIIPESGYANYKKGLKAKMTSGRLHDGQKVIKKFGQWVSLNNPETRIDPKYYPEIAKDDILTEDEWQEKLKIKKLK